MNKHLASILTTSLYTESEHIWQQARQANWNAVDHALKIHFFESTTAEQAHARRAAFQAAMKTALTHAPSAESPSQRDEDAHTTPSIPHALTEELLHLLLFSAFPESTHLQHLCQNPAILALYTTHPHSTPPTPENVAHIFSSILLHLRAALLQQTAYYHLMQRHMRLALQHILSTAHLSHNILQQRYLTQMHAYHRQIDNVCIPQHPQHHPITLQELFIPPHIQHDTHTLADSEVMLSLQEGNEALHPRELRKWSRQSQEHHTIEEALNKTKNLVILGDPGTGKTTVLKYLTLVSANRAIGHPPPEDKAHAAQQQAPPLPLFIALHEYAAEAATHTQEYSLLHHASTWVHQNLLIPLEVEFFTQALQAGRCIVCLDGLDAVPTTAQRKRISHAITKIASQFPANSYIVTSRPAGYSAAPLEHTLFEHYTLSPLSDDAIHTFAHTWYRLCKQTPEECTHHTTSFIANINNEPASKAMARNPLMLKMLATTHQPHIPLPKKRADCYERYITWILETCSNHTPPTTKDKKRPFFRIKRRLLERLAYELHTRAEQSGQLQKVQTDVVQLLITYFLMENPKLGLADNLDYARAEARAFVHTIHQQTGLFIEHSQDIFGFPHRTLQEYLTACDIQNRLMHLGIHALWDEIKPHLHTPHWREVILLLICSLDRYDEIATEFVQYILHTSGHDKFEPVLHRHLYLAASLLAEGIDIAKTMHHKIIDTLATIASQPSWHEQQDALHALARLQSDEYAIQHLQTLAQNPTINPITRCDAAEALSKLGHTDKAAIVLLALAHNQHQVASVRRLAAEMLGTLGHTSKAAQILLSLARNTHSSIRERRNAAEALGSFGYAKQAADVLLSLAHNPQEDASMRRNAAEALGTLGYTNEAAHILHIIAYDPQNHAWQRRYAAEALGNLGYKENAAVVLMALALDQHLQPSVRRFSAEALGRLGHTTKDVIDILDAMSRDTQRESDERSIAAIALGQLGHTNKATATLLTLATDTQEKDPIRRTAAIALSKLGYTDTAIDVLLALASNLHCEPWVRSTAALALERLGYKDTTVLQGLFTIANDTQRENDERCIAAITLVKLGSIQGIADILLTLARDHNLTGWVRPTAYDSLKQLMQM